MDKEEFRIKLEEINRLVEKRDYKKAMEVVDSIDWRRVKNVHTLCVVGEIYAANKRYEDSKEIFLLAYHRAPIGKNILYRLIEVSLKMGDVDEAMDFYEEFLEIAPNDSTQYVLKYKIYKAKKAPLDEQIKILEDYKENEFTEKWSYELAKLYYQNDEKEKCLDLCSEMIIWFSDGKYVMKAMELKNRMGQLSERERKVFESQAEEEKSQESQAEEEKKNEEVPVIDEVKIDERDVNNAESLQEKISKGIRDVFNGIKKESEKEDDLTKEEEETKPEEEIQEEMIRDPGSVPFKEELSKVPALEQEIPAEDMDFDLSEASLNLAGQDKTTEIEEKVSEEEETKEEDKPEAVPEKEPVEEAVKETEKNTSADEAEEKSSEASKDSRKEDDAEEAVDMKIPQLEIPDSMKNFGMKNPLKEDEKGEFNLEDTILAAASAQGIEIPKTVEEKPEKTQKKEEVKEKPVVPVEDDEEPMTEEDLRAAEAEFLNGPAPSEKKKNPDDLDLDDDFSAIMDEIEGVEKSDELVEADLPDFDDDDDDFLPGGDGKVDQEARNLEKFIDSIQPKQDADDIIPREKKLTEKEEKIFTYFAKVPGLKEQIINTLCDVQLHASDKTSVSGNIIVMGGKETGKTRLISALIPAICKELNLEASKVAYVFADQINGKDIAAIVNKLAGGFLVIENANQLKKETVNQLNKAMEFRTDGLIVIIEDEKIGMRKLIARFPKFTSKFTSMINIPVFTNDELVNFARIYTKENGYTIDQMGMLALYNRISQGQKADQPMNVGSVKEIVDSAIAKSQGGLMKLKKKKVNRDGFVVLYEKDFN